MSKIKIQNNPSEDKLNQLNINSWSIWEKEVSVFPWTYSETETCYFLEGDVIVTTEGGEQVQMGAGDLVTFPSGMSCTWNIKIPVKKHYRFE
ncbi:MAG: cupin domain-containing protein [Magnetococcales bacterium]|nr:cupin domain-containing protein [Magnetococcales bacterium]